jgi:hypothetical protein
MDAALYGTRLLKQSSLDRIWTVYPLNDGKPNAAGYGFAWEISRQNDHRRIEHGGAWQGFTCDISRYPDDSLTVVVLTNLDAGHSDPAVIAHVVAGLADAPLLPPKLAPISDTQPAIADALKKFLGQLTAGQDIRPQTAPELAARITPEITKSVQERVSKFWPGGSLALVHRAPVPDRLSISMFRLSKAGEILLISFGLDATGKVSVIGFSADREYE